MAQSSASLALFTSRPSPPPVNEHPAVLAVTGHLSCVTSCHTTAPGGAPSGAEPHLAGHSFYAHPSNPETNCQGAHQSHSSHGWLGRVGQGMDHAASYPGEWEQEQGSPSLHSLTGHQVLLGPLPRGGWLRVKGHQCPHCHPHENDTVTPPPPH